MFYDLNLRYVNNMMNIAWITGVVRHDPENDKVFYLTMTANTQLDIPVSIAGTDFRLPPQGVMRTVVAHIRARNGVTTVQPIAINSTNVANVMPMANFLLGFARKLKLKNMPEGSPYDKNGHLRDEILQELRGIESLTEVEKAMIDLYEMHSKDYRVRFINNSNVVLVSGFVNKAAIVPPNTYQKAPYGMLYLRQHRNTDEAIPIRVITPRGLQQLKEYIKPGAPVTIKGRLRVKLVLSEQGEVADKKLWIETDTIAGAQLGADIRSIPDWFAEYSRYDKEDAPAREAAEPQAPAAS